MSFPCVPGGRYDHTGVFDCRMVTMMKVGIFIFLAQIFGRGSQMKASRHFLLSAFISFSTGIFEWLWSQLATKSEKSLCLFILYWLLKNGEKVSDSELSLESRLRLTQNKYFRIFPTHYSESPQLSCSVFALFSETIKKTFFLRKHFLKIPLCYWKSYLHKQALLWPREECGVPFFSSLYIFAKGCLNRSNGALV